MQNCADDFHRLVHVSWEAPQPGATVVVGPWFDFEHLLKWVAFGVGAIGVSSVATAISGKSFLAWVLGAASGVVCAWLVWWWRYRKLARLPAEVLPAVAPRPDERYRLRLVADARRAQALRYLDNEHPEPLIFRVLFGLPQWPRFVQGLVVMAIITIILVVPLRSVVPSKSSPFGGIYGIFAALAAGAVLMFSWPTYLRVAPGRLDVFRYGFLGRGTPMVRRFDLRYGRVLVNAERKHVVIEDAAGARHLVHYGAVADDLGFARAVLMAARSRRECPPLPDDALVG